MTPPRVNESICDWSNVQKSVILPQWYPVQETRLKMLWWLNQTSTMRHPASICIGQKFLRWTVHGQMGKFNMFYHLSTPAGWGTRSKDSTFLLMCDPAITCVKPAETEVLSLAGSDPSSLSSLLSSVSCRQHSTETITRERSNKLQFGSSSRFIRIKLSSNYRLKRKYVSTVSVQYN